MATAVWFTGLALDQTSLSPRQISLILAAGSLLPVLFWQVANRFQARQLLQAKENLSQ
jgi:hypothetical protein